MKMTVASCGHLDGLNDINYTFIMNDVFVNV